ncbi:MAG: translation initiation factor IF-3 [Planctomycetota bacterium]|nr:translation initiation factor IF-3 [Planctomycetota bacterium]
MATQDYRLNHRIRVPEVRLIDEKGEQHGVVATNEAKRLAQDAGLDLVEVSPNARPPVCKIMDFGKFKYQQRKKDRKGGGGKKGTTGLKEMRVRPAISDHDLSYRLTDGRKFLEEGHKVQVVCIFRGRQMAHPEHGYDVMRRVSSNLEDLSKIEVPARMAGRRMTMMLSALTTDQRRKKAKELEERDKRAAEEAARNPGEKKAIEQAQAANAEAAPIEPAVEPAVEPASEAATEPTPETEPTDE